MGERQEGAETAPSTHPPGPEEQAIIENSEQVGGDSPSSGQDGAASDGLRPSDQS
ncbi:hypothetical protein [Phenylobacterium deserti]|uniref:hypothetical protein n=1 Tax=Phenylobacterium deserti TaxID=1914756 RepID=UPI001402F1C8|nr:hypothetical protein [Phenylobacterium deserti]